MQEEILIETKNRFVLYPIKYNDIFDMYKTAISAFWTVEEIDLTRDIIDWDKKLTDNEKNFITNILSFFAASDGIVNENLGVRFMNEVQIPEAKGFYGFQIAMEFIHSEMYSLMIDTFIKDKNIKDKSLNAIEHFPCIKKKANWALKWIEDKESNFAKRLVAFAIVEGVFFSGAFASIFWLKERNLMPGLCQSNEFISRDEGLHTEFAILLYSMLDNKLDEETIHNIFEEAISIECEFITESIPCDMLGMNKDLMIKYIHFIGDRLLSQLGYDKIWNVNNPFDFMDRICLQSKNNFFENRTSEYARANVGNRSNSSSQDFHSFSIDEEF